MEQLENDFMQRFDLSKLEDFSDIDFIDNDFAIFLDIKDVPIFNYPTRIDLAVLAIPLQGYAHVGINLKDYFCRQNELVIIMPNQIIQLHEKSDDLRGIFFVLSKTFAEEIAVDIQKILPIFFYIRNHPCTILNKQEVDSIMKYHAFLWEKVKMKENIYRKEITQNILRALIFEFYNIFQKHIPAKKYQSRKEELFESFLLAVSENFQKERSVIFYADVLFLTPKHLSRVIKEISGRSAGEWIDEQVVLEAKSRLKSTASSIQEIADQLGFANQSFFGKYFKQHTGISPSEYRKK